MIKVFLLIMMLFMMLIMMLFLLSIFVLFLVPLRYWYEVILLVLLRCSLLLG